MLFGFTYGEIYVFGLIIVWLTVVFAAIGAWGAYFKVSDLLYRVQTWEEEHREERE